MFKIWPRVKVMTWSENVMLHICRSVLSAWAHLWCFRCSSLSLPISGSFIFQRKIACYWQRWEVAAFCDCTEICLWRHTSETWPNLKMGKIITSGSNGGQSCQISALCRKRVRSNREETVGYVCGTNPSRPGRVTCENKEIVLTYLSDFNSECVQLLSFTA